MVNPDKYKKILEGDKKRIEEKIVVLQDIDFGDTPGQDNEEADESEELANELANIEVLKDRLSNIEDALKRIEEKSYGICTRCGKEISEELLDADPESSLCRACKAS